MLPFDDDSYDSGGTKWSDERKKSMGFSELV